MLRGGELGRPTSSTWDDKRGITLTSVLAQDQCHESNMCPWLLIMRVVAIKDVACQNKASLLIPIRRRTPLHHQADRCADPMDTYDALMALHELRASQVRAEDVASTPLFTGPDGVSPWTTDDDTRSLARELGELVGINRDHLGGKAFRIGGATDLREQLNPAEAKFIIKQRGRWATDIASIYQRALMTTHLDASVKVRAQPANPVTSRNT